jgi:glycosyltransferase involved in cell wall biosynthesis
MSLSVIIITLNEEQNIAECLASVAWADEIIVVDAQSTDATVEIAKRTAQRVFTREWKGFAASKMFALEQATHEWVLWLDADERVTPELAEEIQSIAGTTSGAYDGYEVARRAFFIGKWIKHCGWYPGYVIRLFKKKSVRFTVTNVHEKVECEGSVGKLKNDLLHYTDENLFHYYAKFNRYTSLAAQDVAKAGRTFSLYDLLVRPFFLFFKMYIVRRGFLDGRHGLILSLLSAAYVFTKYAKLWELQDSRARDRS